MIDLTKVPPFANAAWANEPDAPCLWCAGTGHINGDYVDGEICNCPDEPYHPDALCECGDPECLGPAETVQAVVDTLVLNSPILKLVKERNEARELVKRLLYTAQLGDDSKDKFDAVIDGHKALFKWRGGAK